MKAFKKSKAPKSSDSEASPSLTKGKSAIFKQEVQDKLIDLIKSGNIEAFEKCVEPESLDLVALNRLHTKSGKTPLCVAAEEGRRTETELLLHTKAVEVDLKDSNGMTASLYAGRAGEFEILQLLIQVGGADPAVIYEPTKETILFMAARYNHIEIVRYLIIDKDQPVEVINTRNESPLWNALKSQHFSLASLLLEHNANINLQRPGGGTALFAACFANQVSLVQFILSHGGNPNIAAEGEETCLMIAARHGYIEIMQLLLEAGASVNAVTTAGRTALITATIAQKVEAVELLLTTTTSSQEEKADIDKADIWGFTALTFACRGGKACLPFVQLLLDHGASVDTIDKSYNTPLLHCCLTRNLAAGLVLLDAGADCEVKNIDDHDAVEMIAASFTATETEEGGGQAEAAAVKKQQEDQEDRRLFLSALAQAIDRNRRYDNDNDGKKKQQVIRPVWLQEINNNKNS